MGLSCLSYPLNLFGLLLLAGRLACQDSAQEANHHVPRLAPMQNHAFLEDLSTWQQHVTQGEEAPVEKRNRGVFPIGNGYAFGYLGLGRRANTMQAITGPSYQTAETWAPKGHYGEQSLDLLEGGRVLALPEQHIWRTRGVNVVITEDASDPDSTLSLSTLSFAIPERTAIVRWVEVANRGKQARRLEVRVVWERGRAGPDGKSLVAEYPAKEFAAELAASRPAVAAKDGLAVDLGEIAPGRSRSFVLTLRTRPSAGAFDTGVQDERRFSALLESCKRHWRKRLSGTATVGCDRKKIADLLEDWKVLMLVQRSEPNGAVSPMVNYRGCWVRDSNGPLLAFLRYGLFKEARELLDYGYYATIQRGQLSNSIPLDLDLSRAREREAAVDWRRIRFPSTELPGWVILQHEWYARATNDIELIRRRWPFLERCFDAMKPDARGTLPTHGDETYLHGAFFSLFPERLPADSFLPADAPGRRARSFANTLIYMMSANAMAEMAGDVDRLTAGGELGRELYKRRQSAYQQRHIDMLMKIEEAFWLAQGSRFAPFLSPVSGKRHNAPYGAVNLLPQWIGYTYAIGEKNRQNLRNTLAALWKRGTRVGMTPTVGYSVGHLQGLLLYSLSDLDDRRRNDALDTLVEMAEPAGEWGELHDPSGRPVGGYDRAWPNRLRPWESGINIDAIFFALNGVRYVCSPGWSKSDQRLKLRLPNRSRWLTMTRLQHDGHQFHIYLDEHYDKDLQIDKSGAPVRKMRFRVVYDRINRDLALINKTTNVAFIDAAINVGDELFIRYPSLETPVTEKCAWPEDKGVFFELGPVSFRPVIPEPDEKSDTLMLSSRAGAKVEKGLVLDVGLPILPEQLAELILSRDASGDLRFHKLLFDVGVTESGRSTFKTEKFWQNESLLAAEREFEKRGGRVLRPAFMHRYQVLGPFPAGSLQDLDTELPAERATSFRAGKFSLMNGEGTWREADSSGSRIDLTRAMQDAAVAGKRFIVYASSIVTSPEGGEYVLRLGSDDGIKVWLNGREILTRKVLRAAAPDQDKVLVRLKKGENRLLFKVYNEHSGCFLIARFTDLDGLPVPGLVYR